MNQQLYNKQIDLKKFIDLTYFKTVRNHEGINYVEG